MKSLVAAALLAASAGGALAQTATFDMTPDAFKERLNRALRADGGDPIRSCQTARNVQTCTFGDRAFQQSVAAMKEMNLLNGRFDLRTRLLIETSGGKVAGIRLTGSREEMANMMAFVSLFINALMTMDPRITADDTKREADTFGLMRGDAAPDIGRERVDIRPYAAITCLNQPSRISMRVQCDLAPRS